MVTLATFGPGAVMAFALVWTMMVPSVSRAQAAIEADKLAGQSATEIRIMALADQPAPTFFQSVEGVSSIILGVTIFGVWCVLRNDPRGNQ